MLFRSYPFIKGYSQLKNLSIEEAAKEVLLNYEIESGFLAESENLRMKYTDIVRKEKDIKNLKTILKNFEVENYLLSSL